MGGREDRWDMEKRVAQLEERINRMNAAVSFLTVGVLAQAVIGLLLVLR